MNTIQNIRLQYELVSNGTNGLLGIETAICRYLQSRMKYAIRAISIPPGAQRMWTRFPENRKGIDNVFVEKKDVKKAPTN